MKRCKGVLLAGMLVLSMSVPVYADKSVVVKVEAPADTTDYYMTVDSGGVGVDIYPSTDGKGEKLNDKTVRDGTVLHIEGETEKNGETWGYTEYNGRYGYVPLEELRPSKDAELAKAGIAGGTEKETSAVNQGDASDTQDSVAVGRKSANLIMGDVFGKPAIVTDTHCIRLSNRIGLVHDMKDPKKVEMALWKIIPPEEGNDLCHRLVNHGREVCTARTKPYCDRCCLNDICEKNGI